MNKTKIIVLILFAIWLAIGIYSMKYLDKEENKKEDFTHYLDENYK